jgi:hypothetical protein
VWIPPPNASALFVLLLMSMPEPALLLHRNEVHADTQVGSGAWPCADNFLVDRDQVLELPLGLSPHFEDRFSREVV